MTSVTTDPMPQDYERSSVLRERFADAMEAVRALAERVGRAIEINRQDRDFDRIHDSLNRLNNRQLALLGLKRDQIYRFVETCVFEDRAQPTLALGAAPETPRLSAAAAVRERCRDPG